MIARAILLAAEQLLHPATLRLTIIVAAIATGIFILFGGLLWMLFDRNLPAIVGADASEAAIFAALVGAALTGWFLFRAVAMAVMGLFTDAIVDAVERDHYPAAAAAARPVSLIQGLAMGLRSAGRAVLWNLLALPLYLLLLVTGVGTLALAVILNAALLGRDLEAMVVVRHPAGGVAPLTARDRWMLGIASSLTFLIPFFNLIAPVFGAALAVHMVHLRVRTA